VPVAPTSVWNRSPWSSPAASSSIARGWSPVGRYASDVFSDGTGDRVSGMATQTRAPHGAYAAIMGTFLAGLGGAGLLARLLGRDPEEHRPVDLAMLGLATFKGARTLARDEVTSFLRDPFVEGHAHEGGEEPVETGDLRQAIGELVTCTRCIGTWVAAGLTATQVVAPRFGRVVTWTLAAAGANDFLQAGFAALANKSNELEQRAG
jgi:hypothetical protein